MADKKRLHCRVRTPEVSLFDGEIESLVFPAEDGEVGIHPGHAAMLSTVGQGEARLSIEGETKRYVVEGGIVRANRTSVDLLVRQVLSE